MSSETYQPHKLSVHKIAMQDAGEQFKAYHDIDASYRIYLYSVLDQAGVIDSEKAKIYAAVR
jgi:hypothetical protein